MYSFLDRLFSIALPRLRDFRGISAKSFDKRGNYTLGFAEHTVFPEIDPTKAAARPRNGNYDCYNSGGTGKIKKTIGTIGMPVC